MTAIAVLLEKVAALEVETSNLKRQVDELLKDLQATKQKDRERELALTESLKYLREMIKKKPEVKNG